MLALRKSSHQEQSRKTRQPLWRATGQVVLAAVVVIVAFAVLFKENGRGTPNIGAVPSTSMPPPTTARAVSNATAASLVLAEESQAYNDAVVVTACWHLETAVTLSGQCRSEWVCELTDGSLRRRARSNLAGESYLLPVLNNGALYYGYVRGSVVFLCGR